MVIELNAVPSGNDGGVVVVERSNATLGPSSLMSVSDGDTFTVIASSTAPITFGVWLDDDPSLSYNSENRYEAYVTLSGGATEERISIPLASFKNGSDTSLTARVGTVLRSGFTIFQHVGPNTINFRSFSRDGAISYPYVPGAQPFTLNTLYDRPLFWRGTLYTGYQAPLIWKFIGDESAFDNCLSFIQASQADYFSKLGIEGPFTPVFYLDRSDNLEFGDANTWGWNAPDPNTFWGGFQYRVIKGLAHVIEKYPSAVADQVLNKFLVWLESAWATSTPQMMAPMNFPSNGAPSNLTPGGAVWNVEPHMAALIGESALIALSHSTDTAKNQIHRSLLKKSYDHIMSQYVSSGKERGSFMSDPNNPLYYGFWHGEIMQFLAALLLSHDDVIEGVGTTADDLRSVVIRSSEWLALNMSA
jgi:hypothetical protein